MFNTSWAKNKSRAFNEQLVKWLMASIKDFCISTNSIGI